MLTKEQLAIIARKYNVGLAVQERDYIQHIFLYLLFQEGQDFYFKGGTCLRIAYGGNRYSEDLDFNCSLKGDQLKDCLFHVTEKHKLFGIEALPKHAEFLKGGFTFDLSFQGPLFDGRSITKNKVRVDVSTRREEVKTDEQFIDLRHIYPDIPVFFLTSISLSDVFAEKIRALMIRGKPRDLYDIWFLLRRGEAPDRSLMNKKLRLYQMDFDPQVFAHNVDKIEEDWKRDLTPLLSQAPEFKEVRQEVLRKMTLG
ncbi:MAG: nucleotidyl transferase AbiEii/AbiGii toxin family protein [Candidatus Latescibacteria bacterium]|nr:nucleotidyl transferase AbiEii/AbiGii toxin family protein [Candidatus Latescibacterota bacterium]